MNTTQKHAERAASTPLSKNLTKFAFYGSLRQGQYNYDRLLAKNQNIQFEKTVQLDGYKMYSFGSFPFVINTGQEKDKITVDLFTVNDELVSKMVHMMELGAGYAAEEVDIEGTPYVVYVYPPERNYESMDYPFVEGGDWVTYLAEENKKREKEMLNYRERMRKGISSWTS